MTLYLSCLRILELEEAFKNSQAHYPHFTDEETKAHQFGETASRMTSQPVNGELD